VYGVDALALFVREFFGAETLDEVGCAEGG